MTGEELIDDISDIVQDDSFDRDKILGFINKALLAIAGRVLLPGLADGNGDVTTDIAENFVALPEDYHRGLFGAVSETRKLWVFPNLSVMLDSGYRGDMSSGSVSAVTTVASTLMYQNVPATAATISLRYYRKPIAVTDTGASPEGIEGHPEMADWLDQAIVGYVCGKKIYPRIEQGLEGNKPDTTYYSGLYEEAILSLSKLVEMTAAKPPPTICLMNGP